MSPRRREQPSRGFALIIVLWSLVLLSLLVAEITGAGGTELLLTRNLDRAAVAQAAADGGVAEAVFHLLDPGAAHWAADGTPHAVAVGGCRVAITVATEAGKINPNDAQPELLAALLHQLGANTTEARALAAAIVGWRFPDAQSAVSAAQYRAAGLGYRPPGAPFESLDELGLVLGVTPDLLRRLTPHLTLERTGLPDPASADAVVLAAMREAGSVIPPASGRIDEAAVSITAAAATGDGGRFVRRAWVHIGEAKDRSLFQIRRWETAD